MDKVKILIVEDDVNMAGSLRTWIEIFNYGLAGIENNGNAAIEAVKNKQIDLILLDIRLLGKLDGIETAHMINQIKRIPIIFLTAATENEVFERAKKVTPSAYLTKPFTKETLLRAIELAIWNFSKSKPADPDIQPSDSSFRDNQMVLLAENIFIKKNNRFEKIEKDSILYTKAESNYIKIITSDGKKYMTNIGLGDFVKKFTVEDILRIHRSYAVNLKKIDSFSDRNVVINGNNIPIGKTYREEFYKKLNAI